jgi:hypothetical protein
MALLKSGRMLSHVQRRKTAIVAVAADWRTHNALLNTARKQP